MQNLFLKFSCLLYILIGVSAPASARLLLYIDDPDTSGIDVLIVDGLGAGVTIASPGSFLDGQKTTVADSNILLPDAISGDQGVVSGLLEKRGYRVTSNVLAFANFTQGPAPEGGNELQLAADFIGVSIAEGGVPSRLVIGASRSFDLNGQGWFMTHTGFGFYTGLATGTQVVATGGIDGDEREFPTSGTNFFAANFTADLNPGSYGFGSGPEDENGGRQPISLDISGANGGLYTMYTRTAFQLQVGGDLGVQNVIFATTPEPISVATWSVVGGGIWFAARNRRRRV